MAVSSDGPDGLITPLNLGGMRGRVLKLVHQKPNIHFSREFVILYDLNSSLETLTGLAKVLNRYGGVIAPDLPGLGGMESFYSIGQKPTLDNMADYLASFTRWRFKQKKIVIVGIGFGFLVATRMLQRFPGLASRVELVISIGGFAHHEDLELDPRQLKFAKFRTAILSLRLPAAASRRIARVNDFRTRMFCERQILGLDNCQTKVELPLYHVSISGCAALDSYRNEQHLRVVFDDFHVYGVKTDKDVMNDLLSDSKSATSLIPPALRRILRS